MKVILPTFQNKEEAFCYLRENGINMIKQKRSGERVSCDYDTLPDMGVYNIQTKNLDVIAKTFTKNIRIKQDMPEVMFRVDVIANLAGWCDSDQDVIIPGAYTKTINDRGALGKNLVYHLKNHVKTTDAIIGTDVQMRTEMINLSEFNIKSDLTQAEALIGSSIIDEDVDEKHYALYARDEIKNHSIGFIAMNIFLCMNSELTGDEEFKKNWDKYRPFVINKEKVDQYGFFFAITEIKLREYSAVLFGASELTPTIESTYPKQPEPSKSDTLQPEPSETLKEKTGSIWNL